METTPGEEDAEVEEVEEVPTKEGEEEAQESARLVHAA
jgi:hypothetical protein